MLPRVEVVPRADALGLRDLRAKERVLGLRRSSGGLKSIVNAARRLVTTSTHRDRGGFGNGTAGHCGRLAL